jgi:glutaredoxin-like protein
MSFLQEKDKEYIRKLFSEMQNNVKIINFTQEIECQYCPETRQILEELVELSDKVSLELYNFMTHKDMVEKYKVDKVPATIIEGDQDYGIRYYGIPSGYEFSSVLEDIIDVSKRDSGLNPESRELLKQIDAPLRLQVFVTPTCPYCPTSVRLAHKIAIENPFVTADMVEATEFPELSMRYNVRGVPRTMIGEEYHVEGALPEKQYITKIVEYFKALKQKQ